MASRALRPVPEIAAQLADLVNAVSILRDQIINAVAPSDVISDARLSVGKVDGFDLTLDLKTNAAPDKAIFLLEMQPIEGVLFKDIKAGAAKGASHRKVITAKVVAA